jgi:hypothetical protein
MTHENEEYISQRNIRIDLRYMDYINGRNTKDETFLNTHLTHQLP